MPTDTKVEVPCPCCGDDSDVWMHEKEKPTLMKEQYICETCGHQWTERQQN